MTGELGLGYGRGQQGARVKTLCKVPVMRLVLCSAVGESHLLLSLVPQLLHCHRESHVNGAI